MGETTNPAVTAETIPDTIAADDPRLELIIRQMDGISSRCGNSLFNDKIVTVRYLFSPINGNPTWFYLEDDLLRIPNFDRKSLAELKEALAKRGLKIGMRIVAADAAALTPETLNGLTPEIQGRLEMVVALLAESMSSTQGLAAVAKICSVTPETPRTLLIRGLEGHPPDQQIVFLERLQRRVIELIRKTESKDDR